MRIKAKFVLSHLLAAMVPLAILAAVGFAVLRDRLEAAVGEQLGVSADAAVTAMEDAFTEVVVPVLHLARRMPDEEVSVVDPVSLLTFHQEAHRRVGMLLLLGPEGAVRAASRPGLAGINLSGHPQVRLARGGTVAAGAVEVQPFTGRKGFPLAVPIRSPDSDRVRAILVAVVEWAPFEQALDRVPVFGAEPDAHHRLVLVQADSRTVLFTEPLGALDEQALRFLGSFGHGQRRTDVTVGGERFIASTSHTHAVAGLPDPGWIAYALVDRETASRSVAQLRDLALAVAAAAAGLTLLLGYLLGSHLVRPMVAMTAAFRRIADGDLSAALAGDTRDDEIGEMARVLKVFRDRAVDMGKLSRAVEQSPASVVITDPDGRIEYVNPRFVQVTGYSPEEVEGRTLGLLDSGYEAEDCQRRMWEQLLAGGEWRGEVHSRRKDGSLFWEHVWVSAIRGPDGHLLHFVAVKEDISARKVYEEELLRQASFDDLTGLPNRLLALDRLTNTLNRAARRNGMAAVIMVDIDRLRTVNDTLGHNAGDDLLRQAAARLTASLREEDTVARLGGDEFLVVLSDLADPLDADVAAAKISAAMGLPFLIEEQDVVLGASVGIAIYPADGDDPHVLVKNADAAMYRAKESGRNGRQFFTPELHEQVHRRLTIEGALRSALANDEFQLHYQPQVDCKTGKVIAAEALLRWNSAELGPVAPDLFIPVAEENGTIEAIGDWVIRTACRDMAAWQAMGVPSLRVAVNVSARQFGNRHLIEVVAESLSTHGIAPDRLEIEVTERLLLGRDEHTRSLLAELKAMGLRLSIDDFGTGYSAMGYLTSFQFDVLKIDKSFVSAVMGHGRDGALAQAIIAMAHKLGLEVVAEGVEEEGQVEFMRLSGCEFLQGFYYSRPLSFEHFAELALRDAEMLLPVPACAVRTA